jgi:hypothetical protein
MTDDPVLKQVPSKRANRMISLMTAITAGVLLLVAIVTWIAVHMR